MKFLSNLYWRLQSPLKQARHLGVTIGKNCLIATRRWSSEPYLITIGNYVQVTEGVCKHSIASMDVSIKSNTFALQNIKQRIWQAVKILKGYWNFTTKSQRQVEYQLFLSVKGMVSFTLSLRGGTRTVIR